MRIRLTAVLFAASLLAAARADAQFNVSDDGPNDYHVELGLMFWQPTPELVLTTGDARVGAVDFVDEFGIGEERFMDFRFHAKAGKHKFRFAYLPIRYDQDAVLRRTITFQNREFPVSANANADIEWDLYTFGYEWDFLSMRNGYLGVVTDLKYNKVAATVTASGSFLGITQTVSAEVDEQAAVPAIGIAGRGYIGDWVSIGGEFTGLKIERTEFRGKLFDFDVSGAAHFGRHVGAQVGYRSLTVEYLVDADEGDMKMNGPYFGGFVRF